MSKVPHLARVFLSGLGLKTALSYVPPVAVAWVFFILYLAQIHKSSPDTFTLTLVLGLLGIVAGSVVVIALILLIVPPLQTIVGITRQLEKGETSMTVPYRTRHDEIGELAGALETFRQTAIAKTSLEREQHALRQQSEEQRRKLGEEMAQSFTTSFQARMEGVEQSLKTQEECAARLERAVQTASTTVGTVTHAAEESVQSMAAVSEATEALAASSHHIGAQAQQSQSVATEAVQGVHKTSTEAEKLKEAAQKIGDVVALIGSIASQTNLLALNATIEAARAGEVGKGFAVVAGEVKALANQTSTATKEITGHIESIQKAIGVVVHDVSMIVETINQSLSISQAIAHAVDDQMNATTAIAGNVRTTMDNALRVKDSMNVLSESVKQVATTGQEVLEATHMSQDECRTMRNDVTHFTAKARNI